MTLLAYWPTAIGSWWLILLVGSLVMMWLMMRSMGSSNNRSSKNTNDIAGLRGESERLSGQQSSEAQKRE